MFGCSYVYPSDQTITNSFWYISSQGKNNDLFLTQEYSGRVEYLGNKDNNCTLKINNLISSDATQYQFRFETVNKGGETNAWSSKTCVSLSLTGNFDTRTKSDSHNTSKNIQWSLCFFLRSTRADNQSTACNCERGREGDVNVCHNLYTKWPSHYCLVQGWTLSIQHRVPGQQWGFWQIPMCCSRSRESQLCSSVSWCQMWVNIWST